MMNHKFLSQFVQTQSKIIVSLIPKLSASLDEKYFHKLRVATRRMRAALWILKHGELKNEIENLNRYLKRMGKLLGKIRDLTVAIADAKKFRIKISKLKLSRRRSIKKVQKMKGYRQMEILSSGLAAAKTLVKNIDPESIIQARHELTGVMDSNLEKTFSGPNKLHRLRITMKKARYVLEAMGESVEALKPLQDALGEAHDLQILRHLVGDNRKIKSKEFSINKEAVGLIKPAILFASSQLKSRSSDDITSGKNKVTHRRI